jgi:hypothetical protein
LVGEVLVEGCRPLLLDTEVLVGEVLVEGCRPLDTGLCTAAAADLPTTCLSLPLPAAAAAAAAVAVEVAVVTGLENVLVSRWEMLLSDDCIEQLV